MVQKVVETAWVCASGHKHSSEEKALRCEEQSAEWARRSAERIAVSAQAQADASERKRQRAIEAARLRAAGKTYKQVGEHFGVGVDRARGLAKLGQWMLDRPPSSFDGLSVRAFNCLTTLGIKTRAEAKQFDTRTLMKVPNLGRTTLAEILVWRDQDA